ncbi:hypothetical protein DPMN_071237 [Dreissena polymorpha]|uniref:Uncharacterized protein n=1 Tax=Dreissena polymorpha TaxID=45954 RepID=A0A9D3Z6C1_DREPO|nr:hypothetical protein DPMN_071237 [Dreissena polymorpha]
MGKGNKPNATYSIRDEEINVMYERGMLDGTSPKAWFNNCGSLENLDWTHGQDWTGLVDWTHGLDSWT